MSLLRGHCVHLDIVSAALLGGSANQTPVSLCCSRPLQTTLQFPSPDSSFSPLSWGPREHTDQRLSPGPGLVPWPGGNLDKLGGPSAPALLHRDMLTSASVPPKVQHNLFLSSNPRAPGAGRPGTSGEAEARGRKRTVSMDVVAACHPHWPPPSPHALFPSTPRTKPPKPTARIPPPLGPWLSPHWPSSLPQLVPALALPSPPSPGLWGWLLHRPPPTPFPT